MTKKKLRKLITIGTICTSIITIINLGFRYVVPFLLGFELSIGSSKAESVGIIGGADGPTAIFLASSYDTNYIAVVFGLLSVAGIIYLIFSKKGIE